MVNKKLVKTPESGKKSSKAISKKKPKAIITSTRQSKRKHRNESDVEKDHEINNDSTNIPEDVDKKKNKGKSIKKDVAVPKYKVIEARQSPKWLNDVIVATNPNQKQVIRDMGFGSLLDGSYDFDFVPVALGGFVVEIFDHENCKFKLPNGRSIKVTKELIHDTLGLPMGGKKIKTKDRSSGNDLVVQTFRKQYCEKPIKAYYIKPLEGIMGLMKEADRLFRLNFLVMATSVLIECTKAGCVNQTIIESIPEKDDDIKGLDWCGYLLESMITCRKEYNFKNHFNGPLLVMVLLYVNSTLLGDDEANTLKPYLSSWNSEKLKERQNREIKGGGFGLGHVRVVDGLEDVIQQKTPSKKRKTVGEKEAEGDEFVNGDADLKNEKRRIIENLKGIENLKKLVDDSLSALIAKHPSDQELHKLQSIRVELYRNFRDVGEVYRHNTLVDAGHVGSSADVADGNNKTNTENYLGLIVEVNENSIGNVGTTSNMGKQANPVRIVDYSTEEDSQKESNVSVKELASDTIRQEEKCEQLSKNVAEHDNNAKSNCNEYQLQDEEYIFADVHTNFEESLHVSQNQDNDVYKLQEVVNVSAMDGDTRGNIEDIYSEPGMVNAPEMDGDTGANIEDGYNEPGMDNFIGSLLNTSPFLQAAEEKTNEVTNSAGVVNTPVVKAAQLEDNLLQKEHEAAATLATVKQQAGLAIVPVFSNKELTVVSERQEESEKQNKKDK